eukprot:10790638-Karenia_brevis.AAC.1
MKQVKFDEGAFSAWEKKCQSAKSALYYKQQEHKLEVHNDCIEAAVDVDGMMMKTTTMITRSR